MLSTKQIFFFFSLFIIISCDSSVNEYKRIRGNALGTTYSVIIETEEKENLIREKIDSIFEVINSSMSTYIDNSVFPKKGQLGYVDKAFITEEEEGFRLAKVRIREERIPAIGDKFCSGPKGSWFSWQGSTKHMAANLGETDRYVIQLTGWV